MRVSWRFTVSTKASARQESKDFAKASVAIGPSIVRRDIGKPPHLARCQYADWDNGTDVILFLFASVDKRQCGPCLRGGGRRTHLSMAI
jgi:hypothetical protein